MNFRPSQHSYNAALISMPSAMQLARPNPATLRRGSSGADVVLLQDLLAEAGERFTPCTSQQVGIRKETTCSWEIGVFDEDTEDAVKVFQSEKGLTVDGIVGRNTWKALGQSSSIASTVGSAVSSVVSIADPTIEPGMGIPFYKQPWFLPVAVGVGIVVVGTLVIALKD